MKPIKINDAVLIGSWESVTNQPLSTITKRDGDNEVLDGLVIRGYETKFADGTNTNGEVYDPHCFDSFVQKYFIDNLLNLPVDVEHDPRPEWKVGRVIYFEVNSVGFYFVAYVPRSHPQHDYIKMMLREGIFQGFSKYGCATDYDIDKKTGAFIIKQMEIGAVSIVSTPANANAFEKVSESKPIENALTFKNKLKEEPKETPRYKSMFH